MRRRQFLFIKTNNQAKFSDKIKAGFVAFCYWLTNSFLKLSALIFWPRKIEKSPKKICVYRVGNIGDIICSIPAFISIRRAYPEAHIVLLTSTGQKGIGAKDLLLNAWFIDKLWEYRQEEISGSKNIREFIQKMRLECFDLLISLPQDHITFRSLIRNLFFLKSCGVKKAIGFELSVIRLWAHSRSEVYFFEDEVSRLVNLLRRWGIPASDKIEYDLPISREIEKSALKIIEENKINAKFIFGFVPGAGYDANQWPLDNFVEVGKFILKNYHNSQIIIFGGLADFDKGNYIKDKIGSNSIINLAGKLSLLENAFIINKLNLMVSNNTGLMHMASLVGKNVIAIFSATELNGKWFPYGKNSQVLMGKIKCEGCYYKPCPYDYKCIKDVNTEEVIENIKIFL